jgi:hypothetical protein
VSDVFERFESYSYSRLLVKYVNQPDTEYVPPPRICLRFSTVHRTECCVVFHSVPTGRHIR